VDDVSAAMCFSGAGVRIYTPWPVPGSACTPPAREVPRPGWPPALPRATSSEARQGRIPGRSSISIAR
jgi:hypothetical protein